jgi:hypothetical protein
VELYQWIFKKRVYLDGQQRGIDVMLGPSNPMQALIQFKVPQAVTTVIDHLRALCGDAIFLVISPGPYNALHQ